MKSALLIGHPGHELMVHGWLERGRPVVFVVTDGAGRAGVSRIASSTAILEKADAQVGSVYARISDADAYATFLACDARAWAEIANEVATSLIEREVDCLVADALEGYNPVHDMTRYVADAVVALVEARAARRIRSFEFALFEEGERLLTDPSLDPMVVDLDDRAWDRKRVAGSSYVELRPEFERTLENLGVAGLRRERFHPVAPGRDGRPLGDKPLYEVFGESRVAAGAYGDVIRYDAHVRPLVDAMWSLLGIARPR